MATGLLVEAQRGVRCRERKPMLSPHFVPALDCLNNHRPVTNVPTFDFNAIHQLMDRDKRCGPKCKP